MNPTQQLVLGLVVALSVGLAGCATSVTQPAKRSRYGPVNEPQSGVVKYLAQGADFVIEQRREDAYKEMYRARNGKYRIDREEVRGDEEYEFPAYGTFGGKLRTKSNFVYIYYSCVKEPVRQQAPKRKEQGAPSDGREPA